MITRNDLVNSKEYWMVKIQTELFAELEKYLSDNNMTRTQFAEKLGVSKGYVSQVLNGDFNHSLSKLIELSLAIGKVPVLHFEDLPKQKPKKLNVSMDNLAMPIAISKAKSKRREVELV
jgi:transcriptional regulator with XRE-family HTH domain